MRCVRVCACVRARAKEFVRAFESVRECVYHAFRAYLDEVYISLCARARVRARVRSFVRVRACVRARESARTRQCLR